MFLALSGLGFKIELAMFTQAFSLGWNIAPRWG
jgi:hypothetical protein